MLDTFGTFKIKEDFSKHDWFKTYAKGIGLSKFCLVVEFHQGESATGAKKTHIQALIWVRFLRMGIGPELCDFFKKFGCLL